MLNAGIEVEKGSWNLCKKGVVISQECTKSLSLPIVAICDKTRRPELPVRMVRPSKGNILFLPKIVFMIPYMVTT